MSTLAIPSQWNPLVHGFGNNEDPEIIKILSKLIFVWELGCYPPQRHSFNAFKFLKESPDVINTNYFEETGYQPIVLFNILLIKGFYIYKSRMFAIPNKPFGQFLVKVKKRYKNKTNKKKNIKNLLNRQIYGKFIHK